MDARVPGGSKAVLAEQEPGIDDEDEGIPDRAPADHNDAERGSRPTSQSLPRSYNLLHRTASSSGLSPGARKVDSLPGSLIHRTRSSTPDRKKRSTSKMLRSFGSFVQKVARQLQAAATVGNSSSRSRTPTRQTERTTEVNRVDGSDSKAVGGEQVEDGSGVNHVNTQPPGVVGIQNHGNTCFINAIVQCLANTEPLAQYLVTNRYQSDIRRSAGRGTALRPGARGELTESFASVVRALWTRTMSSEVSSDFRSTVSRHGVQYRGCMQHDAQEFLLWLLDRVHEDVNIATKKKYRANKSNVGRPDEVVAAEALANHSRCNNSFIYNLFQALYRSSLTCPSCHHHSNTFDPFLSLSLPIPHRECHIVNVIVLSRSELAAAVPKAVMMGFATERDDTMFELRRMVAEDTRIPRESIVLLRVDISGFRNTLCDTQPVSELTEFDNVFAVEVPTGLTGNNVTAVIVNSDSSTELRFGPLMVLYLSQDLTLSSLKTAVHNALCCYFTEEFAPSLEELLSVKRDDCSVSTTEEYPLQQSTSLCTSSSSMSSAIKLVAQWEKSVRESYESHVTNVVEQHESVKEVKSAMQQPSFCTLEDCFQLYTKEERLGADDAWLCPHCRKYQQDTVKALSLWSFPEILIIQLKRFKQDATSHCKLNTLVTFPVTALDVSRHCRRQLTSTSGNSTRDAGKAPGSSWLTWKPGRKVQESPDDHIYDLYAVCNHYGNMQGGHYTAFCKNAATGRWYSFNDSRATDMREEEVVTRAAYLLFYERRSAVTVGNRSHDWLWQLSTNGNVPRTVTSHSLENIIDNDKVNGATMTDSVINETSQQTDVSSSAAVLTDDENGISRHDKTDGNSATNGPVAADVITSGENGLEFTSKHATSDSKTSEKGLGVNSPQVLPKVVPKPTVVSTETDPKPENPRNSMYSVLTNGCTESNRRHSGFVATHRRTYSNL